MRVLIVHSGNHAQVAPFISEQAEALCEAGCEVLLFAVEGRGMWGYLRCLPTLKKTIAEFMPDVVHAHYGLCGLLCTLQHKVPVVITYHGSDINNRSVRLLSQLAMHRAAYNIFVSKKLLQKVQSNSQFSILNFQFSILPCGVDTRIFHPMPREEALKILEQSPAAYNTHAITHSRNNALTVVLFAGAFDNEVKNPQLAKDACALVPNAILLELKGYNRTEVAALMNLADVLLMTSHSEGSPQVVKEALACGLPIVSVDVGDVAELIGNTDCGMITKYKPEDIAKAISQIIEQPRLTNLLNRLAEIDNKLIATKIINVYKRLCPTLNKSNQ